MPPGYSETLLEHARHPHNIAVACQDGKKGIADFGGRPPIIEIFLQIQSGVIQSAHFQAAGCGVAIACGSVLTDLVMGMSVEEAKLFDQNVLSQALDGIPTYKMFCAEVALAALRDALT